MADRIRSKDVITVDEEIVYTVRIGKKGPRERHYEPGLQEIFLSEGEPSVRDIGMRWYQGYVRVRK